MTKPNDVAMPAVKRPLLMRCLPFLAWQLPLRWSDRLNHFRVQTKLIFSKSILMMLAAMFIGFSYMTYVKEVSEESAAFMILLVQSIILAVLMNMNLLESEKEGKTFELLIMRIPSVDSLIFFKLRVSLIWMILLSLPFFAGYGFFLSLSPSHLAICFTLTIMSALLAAMLTCIVTTFVHHSLTSGIITLILFWMLIGFQESVPIPHIEFWRIFINPFSDSFNNLKLSGWKMVRFFIYNRLLWLACTTCLYLWLRHRLSRTEKWIG